MKDPDRGEMRSRNAKGKEEREAKKKFCANQKAGHEATS